MSDSEMLYDSDQDVSKSHSQLIEAVSELDKGQRIKRPERSEPTLEVSEFHLVKSGLSDNDPVRLNELAKTLRTKGHHAEIVKKLRSAQKSSKVLPKPLEKPTAERIKRITGFQNTQKDLAKWNAIISKNRVEDSISFPLNQPSMKLRPSKEFLRRFSLQSELAKELAALEPPEEPRVQKEDKYKMTLEEIIEKRKEAARFRAQQSYKEAKASRQRKIKSKKFHRIQRKQKIKEQLKEFEILQKTNPEAALEKLEQLDKSRAEERMSLRHKSTGQWAKSKLVRAKYDKDTRQVLAQQLSIGRELTQKVTKADDSEDEDNENVEPLAISKDSADNPWVGKIKTNEEINDFISTYRKYWEEKNDEKNTETTDERKNNFKRNNVPHKESSNEVQNSVTNEDLEQESKECIVNGNSEKENLNEGDSLQEEEMDSESSEDENVEKLPEKVLSNKTQDNISERKEATCSGPVLKTAHSKSNIIPKKGKKKKVVKRVFATSEWIVESLPMPENEEETSSIKNIVDINDMFDSMEDKIKNKLKEKLTSIKEKYDVDNKKRRKESGNDESSEEDVFEGLEFKNKKRKPDFNEPMIESTNVEHSKENKDIADLKTLSSTIGNDNNVNATSKTTKEAEIDPNKYINVKPVHLKTQFPHLVTGGNEGLDDSEDEEAKHNIISEAFADDNVVDEFRKEKENEAKKSQPEDLDLSLPGWGSWGGKNIRRPKRKQKRFILKFPKNAPRKDENKGNVIIIEEKDPKIREHQVSELPYPFTSVKDFEASIRAPIGRNFVPENVHKKFIDPAVKTKLGKIIEPMTEDVLVNKKQFKVPSQLAKRKDKPKPRK